MQFLEISRVTWDVIISGISITLSSTPDISHTMYLIISLYQNQKRNIISRIKRMGIWRSLSAYDQHIWDFKLDSCWLILLTLQFVKYYSVLNIPKSIMHQLNCKKNRNRCIILKYKQYAGNILMERIFKTFHFSNQSWGWTVAVFFTQQRHRGLNLQIQ